MASYQEDLSDDRDKTAMLYKVVSGFKVVWIIEEVRAQENTSPSEALLYAVRYSHVPYAKYLLSHFPEEALKVPGDDSPYPPSSAPHLAIASEYEWKRRKILGLILSAAHKLPSLSSYINKPAGLDGKKDGKTALHLACERWHDETALILLGNGASPRIEDSEGRTPLDVILEQMWECKVSVESLELILDYLLLFRPRPRFKMRQVLQHHTDDWILLLGEDKFNLLAGNVPASLYLQAMQTVLQTLPPSRFPRSIQELPVPQALKPFPSLVKDTSSDMKKSEEVCCALESSHLE